MLNGEVAMKQVDAVYIHVPFCAHICNYCDFPKVLYNPKFADAYLEKLEQESRPYQGLKVSSVYLGGGTPTALSNTQLEKLLALGQSFLKVGGEYCLEVNSESCDASKIALFKKYGINRISIGVQTFADQYLKLLNRHHTGAQVIELVTTLKRQGFNKISVDLMFGFPFQSETDLKLDLQKYLALDIGHISCYPLMLEEHTVFHNQGVKSLDDDEVYQMYELINKTLSERGYRRYETSNFARDGQVSQHNLKYWHDAEYLGLGPGASGYLDGVRYDNTRSITDYLKGVTRVTEHKIQGAEEEFEYIMLNLRLREGLQFADYERRFHKNFLEVYKRQVKMLKERHLLDYDDHSVFITEAGVYLANYVITNLTLDLNY